MSDSVSSRVPSQRLTQVLKVALPSPLRRLFDYLPARATPNGGWQPGLRVRVPFGRREVVGVIVELTDHSDLPRSQLRNISETLDDAPLPHDWLWLCRFAARYYQHSLGDTLHHAMPARLRQGHPMAGRTQTLWLVQGEDTEEILSRAPKQAALYALLRQHPQGLPSRAVSAHGYTRDQLLALEKKGLATSQEHILTAPNPPSGNLLAAPALPLKSRTGDRAGSIT